MDATPSVLDTISESGAPQETALSEDQKYSLVKHIGEDGIYLTGHIFDRFGDQGEVVHDKLNKLALAWKTCESSIEKATFVEEAKDACDTWYYGLTEIDESFDIVTPSSAPDEYLKRQRDKCSRLLKEMTSPPASQAAQPVSRPAVGSSPAIS